MTVEIAFLDRNTLSQQLVFPELQFAHRWHFYAQTSLQQRFERLANVQALLTNKVIIDDALLSQCTQLKYIGVTATGYNNIDLDACRRRGVLVTNVAGYSTDAVAEHVFAFILALRKQIKAYQHSIADGAWARSEQFTYFHEPIDTIKGSTLGLIGTGAIACAVAKLAAAFGVTVLWYSPSGRKKVNGCECVSLDYLLRNADLVSLHCPLTQKTSGLIDAQALAKMKSTALLINTARGPIVDGAALAEALKNKSIAGAGIDVLAQEPPPDDDALLALAGQNNVLMTPHTAWASLQSQQQLLNLAVAKLNTYFTSGEVENLAGA
ncbi:NAD(P)-dependent oxidoreductase [Agaribacterium haliotis]|uniref:NAD(P)-dependent oxidoreductase n=1 Tax=Agaribacterium haliotis TaxID=2013869 RepID=UPI000BB53ED9|nr:NAD(P)-dependent oxidoreductase [Agaribacterium haliotis]